MAPRERVEASDDKDHLNAFCAATPLLPETSLMPVFRLRPWNNFKGKPQEGVEVSLQAPHCDSLNKAPLCPVNVNPGPSSAGPERRKLHVRGALPQAKGGTARISSFLASGTTLTAHTHGCGSQLMFAPAAAGSLLHRSVSASCQGSKWLVF